MPASQVPGTPLQTDLRTFMKLAAKCPRSQE